MVGYMLLTQSFYQKIKYQFTMKKLNSILSVIIFSLLLVSCGEDDGKSGNNRSGGAMASNAAERVYVAPGEHDEFYAFISGGYSGNLTVYGLPSGRMLKEIPVFSQFPTSGYGYSEETRPMLNTSLRIRAMGRFTPPGYFSDQWRNRRPMGFHQ